GTYIRALARDLGRATGSAAHCAELRRTRIGAFRIEDAVSALEFRERALAALVPAATGLARVIAREPLDAARAADVRHGRGVPAVATGDRAALLDPEGALLAIAERRGALWQPTVVLAHD
ncbi:MAG: tRNA pseudouridine(55) synthase TruB, partial [Gemmatimonadetes bacterium]|nr:tRNA pseudouridine(55) synthase TruB [Gemmatimonadota bacterium]